MGTPNPFYSPLATASPFSVTVNQQPAQLCPALGKGAMALIYNQDLTNVVYIGYGLGGLGVSNSIPVQPLTPAILAADRVMYAFCPTGSAMVTVGPGASYLGPSPSQIAEQIALKGVSVSINTAGALAASGDTTGVTDFNNITALLSAGFCALEAGQTFYTYKTVIVPNNGIFTSTRKNPYASFRDAGNPSNALLVCAAGATMNAVVSDVAWTNPNPAPAASSNLEISDLDIDCASGASYGIALLTQASAIVNNRVRNYGPGDGILVTDTSQVGNATGSGSLNQNYIAGNRVGGTSTIGGIGIHQASAGSLGTDGYLLYNTVDQDFAVGSGVAIQVEQASDWHIEGNHVYACPGDGYHILRMSHTYFHRNFADNFGLAGLAATTYLGFLFHLAEFGGSFITDNYASTSENSGSGSSNYTYFDVEPSSPGKDMMMLYLGNFARQIAAGTGTHLSTRWNAGTGRLWIQGASSTNIMESIGGTNTLSAAQTNGAITFQN